MITYTLINLFLSIISWFCVCLCAWLHHVYRKSLHKYKGKKNSLAAYCYRHCEPICTCMQRDLRLRKLLPSYPNKIDGGNDTRFTFSCVPCFVSFIRNELYRKAVCLLFLNGMPLILGQFTPQAVSIIVLFPLHRYFWNSFNPHSW